MANPTAPTTPMIMNSSCELESEPPPSFDGVWSVRADTTPRSTAATRSSAVLGNASNPVAHP